MPPQISNNGQWATEYFGPYSGLNVEQPESLIPDNASPAISNFLLRNAELRSAPKFSQHSNLPISSGASNVFGIASFRDINSTYHTVAFSNNGAFQYNPPNWVNVNGNLGIPQFRPVSHNTFASQLWVSFVAQYSTSLNFPFVGFWDGIAAGFVGRQTFGDGSTSNSVAGISLTDSPTVGGSLPGGPTVVGPLAIGGQYIGELNNQIILANITVLDQNSNTFYNFPNMIWWCANGLPLQWDPTANTSAGFNPFLDVPDQITGIATLGVAGYLFRTNGITQFSPTGNALSPFQFNHMWASDHGIGSVYPFSIAQYGPNACFVAEDNIYALSLTTSNPIGGMARDAIMRDLAISNALNTGNNLEGIPVAAIIPKFNGQFVYLTYQIAMLLPSANGFVPRIYIYSFEDKNWEVLDPLPAPGIGSPSFALSCPPNYV